MKTMKYSQIQKVKVDVFPFGYTFSVFTSRRTEHRRSSRLSPTAQTSKKKAATLHALVYFTVGEISINRLTTVIYYDSVYVCTGLVKAKRAILICFDRVRKSTKISFNKNCLFLLKGLFIKDVINFLRFLTPLPFFITFTK